MPNNQPRWLDFRGALQIQRPRGNLLSRRRVSAARVLKRLKNRVVLVVEQAIVQLQRKHRWNSEFNLTWPFSISSRLLIRLVIVGLAILAAYASLQTSTVPFAWFWLAWFLALFCFGLTARTTLSKAVWVNVSAAVLALALGELYLWKTKIVKSNSYCCDDLYFIRDDDMGVVPRKSFAATHVKTVNSVPIYKVTYTIDANGLRVPPPYEVDNVPGSVLFFGCSYTMGDGVEDRETMPYMTGLLTHGRYAVYNFGFHGYGPLQMLAALETGQVQSIVTVPPRHIIYQAIPYHMERVVGLMSWFPHAPRYRRTESGRVVPDGHLDTVVDVTRYSAIERFWRRGGSTGEAISTTLRRSLIYDHFVPPYEVCPARMSGSSSMSYCRQEIRQRSNIRRASSISFCGTICL